ncbi:hypothetical protein ACHQM5_023380 [Ranunculus cassubicifolius]
MVSGLLRIPTKDIRRLFQGLTTLNNRSNAPSVLTGYRNRSFSCSDDSKESLLRSGSSHEGMKIPRGYLAVYVGPEMRRYVIPAKYLSLPDFRILMENVAEEFGFEQEGALKFPCEKEEFEEILIKCYTKHQSIKNKTKK